MTRPEILQLRGQLAVNKKRLNDLTLEAAGLIVLIRTLLPPYEDDITRLEVPKAAQNMARLSRIHAEIVPLKKTVAEMESDLDG